jgi:putative tricarboxylic transport membrane protein
LDLGTFERTVNLRRSNIAVAVLLAGLAGWLLLEANKLAFGSIRVPQTAFFPKVLASLLLVFSLVLLFQSLRQPESGESSQRIEPEGWFRIGATLATLIGFAFVLERLGFLLSTFLLMVLLLRAIEPQKWLRVFSVALATSVIAYLIFAWLLNIPLPAGILGI